MSGSVATPRTRHPKKRTRHRNVILFRPDQCVQACSVCKHMGASLPASPSPRCARARVEALSTPCDTHRLRSGCDDVCNSVYVRVGVCFSVFAARALEVRRERLRNGEAEEKLPAVLPCAPSILLGDSDSDESDSEEELEQVVEGENAAAVEKSFARRGTGERAKDEEESVDVSEFVKSMSDSDEMRGHPAPAHTAGNEGFRLKARTTQGRGKRPSRPISEDDEGGMGDSSSLKGGYQEQVERELQRMGGVDKVPPLSSLIQQLECQDGNTL